MEDLDKLMLFYREWAHYMYPKFKFTDFVTKVRKECSGKLMKQYLYQLRQGATEGSHQFAEVDLGLDEIRSMVIEDSNAVTHSVSRAPESEEEEEEEEGHEFDDDEEAMRDFGL